jgi:hypothetical protein
MTPVLFRRYKDGEIVALFPAEPADVNGLYVSCYAHVGQHGSADLHGTIAETRPAKPAEYADLEAELRDYGSADDKPYADLKVYKRATAQHRDMFNSAMREIRRARES